MMQISKSLLLDTCRRQNLFSSALQNKDLEFVYGGCIRY